MLRVICFSELRTVSVGGVMLAYFSGSSAASFFVFRGPIVASWYFRKRLFSEATSRAKLEYKRRNTLHKQRKNQRFVNDVEL